MNERRLRSHLIESSLAAERKYRQCAALGRRNNLYNLLSLSRHRHQDNLKVIDDD